ncbi:MULTISPECIES: SDR family oxidoreductase [unclassified Achromobacter]|uniref:SDR family oxidoreductase n=1 Tax=unclassified Achromobacter TaxID=2626865 RepID=UPI000B51CE69|nr:MULTISPECIES: SDR family oxidoreductase [unclassified Achromobacter]OWT80195.1 short-chain dehydrogenase [Achromobacter sp. HZ34]OWT82078.1 short-chain dehydrogenase [Achromobacter sp. HZ28]
MSKSKDAKKAGKKKDQHKQAEQQVEATADKQRAIQQEQDQRDQASAAQSSPKEKHAMQAGQRKYAEPPLPDQRIGKPGLEADMEVRPAFSAPGYRGSGKLDGFGTIVTGGDSGIGRAVAILFAREGADVAIVYLNEHEDAEETKRCVEAEGKRCVLISGDVKDPAFCRNAVDTTLREFGKLDVLVNNAAFQEHASSIVDLSEERFDETMRTNVYGYFHMAKAAVPHLKEGGSIVNSGSVTGLRGSGDLIDYSTTKGAIHAFTMSLASNLAPKGVRVNAVAPGPVWTPFNPGDKPPEALKEFGAKTLMGRPAQPEELAPAYVFLAAPACASYITGMILPVTGSPG